MSTLIVPSGADVEINTAPWKDAKALKRTIEREIALSGGISLPTVLLVDSSEMVDAALWPCLVRCTYNKEKITESTFDKPEARGDYYDIVQECVKVNLGPLVQSLLSKLSEHGLIKKQAPLEKGQKSK